MSERLTKQQLKQDALVKTTADFADFASEHTTLLIAGAVALVLAVIAFNFVRAGAQRADARAAAMLTEAWSDYNRGQLDAASARLADLQREAGGTKPGKQALLLLANIHYDQGKYEQARAEYEQVRSRFAKDSVLGLAAQRGLAATLENLKQYGAAAKIYEQLAEATASHSAAANLRLAAARNFVKAGKTAEALALYQELAADATLEPQVVHAAKLRLAELRLRLPAPAAG